ncbi:small nuclear ribonucleoprotein Sm D3-like [Argiope bruennichi]|uniref:Small nuclear ribonucleoprotein Sm D3 like protein n=1 Tax=Argiope bruennichi TaxID=94029 RepID=A0A8T0G1R1_ARGBR|nr:small nuclear ribonucleoprotein Sm D3-like [Argiope bruennichi]KAF8795769.1 Small nuclear ribonucleoprotein Sm D3 like protein [Argiope bruennichi]
MATTESVPVKLLYEFIGAKINVDTNNGESFTGVLVEAQENMSMTLGDVTALYPSGHTHKMENVFIKGHKIRVIELPPGAKDSIRQIQRALRPPAIYGRGRGRGRGGFRGGRR